jgi:hypothetical protein
MNLLPLLPDVGFHHFLQTGAYESVVGVATDWTLQGLSSVRDFPHPFRQTLRLTQLSVQWAPCFFAGDKSDLGVALTTHPHLACSRVNFTLLSLPVRPS